MKNIERLVRKTKEKNETICYRSYNRLLTVSLFLFVGATQQRADDLNTIMGQLDNYVKDQLGKDKAAGRFQLQSFQIERTWHYMLDTATGQLFRLEPVEPG